MSIIEAWRQRAGYVPDDATAIAIENCADDLDAACTAREAPPSPGDLAEPWAIFVAWFRSRPGARLVTAAELQGDLMHETMPITFSRWQKFTPTAAGLVPCGWAP